MALVLSPLPAFAAESTPAGPGPATQQTSAVDPPESTDRVIVKFTEPLDAAGREQVYQDAAAATGVQEATDTTEAGRTITGAQVVELADLVETRAVEQLAEELAADPAVAWAEPDRLVSTAALPDDPHYPKQWGMQKLDVPTAWDTATGAGVVIGVVDTGITTHPDLDVYSAGGHDFVSDARLSNDGDGRDADSTDAGSHAVAGQCYEGSPATSSSWHGTHVAGIAAANAHDGAGVVGVAPDARILSARALGACDLGYLSDIAAAITWLVGAPVAGAAAPATPAEVVNLSLGWVGECGPTMQNAVNASVSRGVPVIVASGNSGIDASRSAPANCQNVLTVGASTIDGTQASYSNHGTVVDVLAPGGDASGSILSTGNTGTTTPQSPGFRWMRGTSMAAPHVAGTAALLLQKNPSLSPEQIQHAVVTTATSTTGHRIVNPVAALAAVTTTATTVTPGAVVFTDKDGTANDTYTIPATTGVEYLIGTQVKAPGTYPGTGTVTVTARAKTGYVLATGATTTWTKTFASTTAAKSVIPAAVVFTDRAGSTKDTYTIPTTTGVAYLVGTKVKSPGTYRAKGTVTVTARAKAGYVLATGSTTTWTKTFATTSTATATAVTPAAVVFTDRAGATKDTYTIPSSTGVAYLVGNKLKAPGTYRVKGKVTVTARAKTGYVLATGATTTWTKTFAAASARTPAAAWPLGFTARVPGT